MALTILQLPHLPPDLQIYTALYSSVTNTSPLRAELLAGNPDYEYAFIDAATILSPTHLSAAIFRAANDHLNNRLRTRNIHSEIVYALGYTNNIASTLSTFGISNSTKDMLVVKVIEQNTKTREDVQAFLTGVVQGQEVDFTEENVKERGDVQKIRKIYKLGSNEKAAKRWRKDGSLEGTGAKKEGGGMDAEHEREELEVQVLGLMALRGAV